MSAGRSEISVRALARGEIAQYIGELARLRIEVFRDFPYLYEGDFAYEQEYLKAYQESDAAILVGAFSGGQLVGAATGTPLSDHHDEFAAAFATSGQDLERTFYCAESVLLAPWRGLGLGHVFFDEREAHARRLGFTHSCFCAVVRKPDHPKRPAAYSPLDNFWQKRGYERLEGVTTEFAWTDTGEMAESSKTMQFWLKKL